MAGNERPMRSLAHYVAAPALGMLLVGVADLIVGMVVPGFWPASVSGKLSSVGLVLGHASVAGILLSILMGADGSGRPAPRPRGATHHAADADFGRGVDPTFSHPAS